MNQIDFSHLRAAAVGVPRLKVLFEQESSRARDFTFDACGIHADFSRQLISSSFLSLLRQFFVQQDVANRLQQMFDGQKLNVTEGRAVMHTALRDRTGDSPEAKAAHHQLQFALSLSEVVRSSRTIDAVVNIGIGGSDLGPAMATKALRRFCNGPDVRFISNVDGADFDAVTADLDPARTLFVVSSKTFTTSETMHNARRAREWVQSSMENWSSHFVAATANPVAAHAWGIEDDKCLEFYEWVGGRFSLSSVIGFPLMCAIGADAFVEFLDGMHRMDLHVRHTDISENLAAMHALVWFANSVCHEMATVAVVPYSHDLGRLPAYLQQLVMESNGKSVGSDGEAVQSLTSPVVWGEPGTNGQHAFFQMIHQGTQVVPVEFIGTVAPLGNDAEAHDILVANMIAQSEALAMGRTHENPHKVFSGNRPSTVIMVDELTPSTFGSLVAMYEHSTAIQGWLMGVNSFDQFGVELGKEMAITAADSIIRGEANATQTMTHPLMDWYLKVRKNFTHS